MDPNERLINLLEQFESCRVGPEFQEELKLLLHCLKTCPQEEQLEAIREFVDAHPKMWDVVNTRQKCLPKPKDDEAFRFWPDEFYAD